MSLDTVVYYGEGFDRLGLSSIPGARRAADGSLHFTESGPARAARRRRVLALGSLDRTLRYVRHRPVDALIVDARGEGALERARALLDAICGPGQVGGPVLRSRILALVEPGDGGAHAAFALGRYGLGGVCVEPSAQAISDGIGGLLTGRGHGKIAICLAGGGIEGLLYEVGVLRALQEFLPQKQVIDFDFFCGISAGAIVGALLANGVGPDVILGALEGRHHRLAPLGRWDLFEPNVAEVSERLAGLARGLVRSGADARAWASALTRAVPTALLSGRRLGRWLEEQLSAPGLTDSFAELRRPLYVGATDQDTAEAVLFGDEDHRHVPISRAVRASCALVPFYPPVEVDGRYYVDGAFSRTTNMRVAANLGATLVILVDPLVPVRSARAGYVRERGGIFSGTQGLKALINGRFDKAVHAIREMHPSVAFHLFRPEGEEMRILSGSPMKYFYRREVEQIAYESTLEKLRTMLPQLSRDFALHGVSCLDPAADDRSVAGSHPAISVGSLGV